VIPAYDSRVLNDQQKRTFIALACKVAWADGVVTDEERVSVAQLMSRIGGAPIEPAELDRWLASGAPPAELEQLPPAIGDMFIYEAMKLVEADHDMSDAEMRMIEDLVARVVRKHDVGTKVAQVAVVKRPF
jgi:uncharacterized tellurite resistance protein B-like protein